MYHRVKVRWLWAALLSTVALSATAAIRTCTWFRSGGFAAVEESGTVESRAAHSQRSFAPKDIVVLPIHRQLGVSQLPANAQVNN